MYVEQLTFRYVSLGAQLMFVPRQSLGRAFENHVQSTLRVVPDVANEDPSCHPHVQKAACQSCLPDDPICLAMFLTHCLPPCFLLFACQHKHFHECMIIRIVPLISTHCSMYYNGFLVRPCSQIHRERERERGCDKMRQAQFAVWQQLSSSQVLQ